MIVKYREQSIFKLANRDSNYNVSLSAQIKKAKDTCIYLLYFTFSTPLKVYHIGE